MTLKEHIALAQESKTEVKEIYTLINDEVNNDADLSGATSASKTAVYKLWMYVFAFLSWLQERLFNEAKMELQAIVDEGENGTDRWLAKEVVKFQYGDSLVFDTATAVYSYAVIDETKQIIKRKAIISQNGLTLVKVAKEDGGGNPLPLAGSELTAFESYLNAIQWAGTNIKAVSIASDKLWIPATIYFDALLTQSVVAANVEAAILGYLANLPFNAEFSLTKLVDAIQLATGVVDVVLGDVQARPDTSTFSSVSRVYYPNSGYFEIDISHQLSSTLNYSAA